MSIYLAHCIQKSLVNTSAVPVNIGHLMVANPEKEHNQFFGELQRLRKKLLEFVKMKICKDMCTLNTALETCFLEV